MDVISEDKKDETINNLSVFQISKAQVPMPKISAINQELKSFLYTRDYIEPPYDPESIASYIQRDPTHQACLNLKAFMVAGMGYEFLNWSDMPGKFKDFIDSPNQIFGNTFLDICLQFWYNHEIYNNAYLEIIRTAHNLNIYNANSKNIFIKPKKKNGRMIPGFVDKFIQINSALNDDSVELDPYNGKSAKYKHYLYQLKGLSAKCDYYGTPTYLSVLRNIDENAYIVTYNTNFFRNNGQPNFAIFFTGTSFSSKEREAMRKEFEDSFKGIDNQHKSLIFAVNSHIGKDKPGVIVEKLSQPVDGSFKELNNTNRDLIAMIHGVPPKILGIAQGSSFGGGTADIGALKSFIETTIKPKQAILENYFNNLFSEEFGENPRLKFRSLDVISEKDKAVIDSLYFNMLDGGGYRAKNIDEIREGIALRKDNIVSQEVDAKNGKIAINNSGDIRSDTSLDNNASNITNIDVDKYKDSDK